MHAVVRSDELGPATAADPGLVRVEVGGADVLVGRTEDGAVIAIAATCPHQGTPLDEATYFDGKLRCARHLYLYDPVTGENLIPARDARPESLWKLKPGYLAVHRAEERDGWVWVADQPEPPPPSYDPAMELRPGTPGAALAAPPVPAGPAGPDEPGDGPEVHRVRVGEALDLVIPFIPLPSHLWRLEGTGGLLSVEGERFEHDPTAAHRFCLRAVAPGQAELTAAYAMPWGGRPAEERSFTVIVDA